MKTSKRKNIEEFAHKQGYGTYELGEYTIVKTKNHTWGLYNRIDYIKNPYHKFAIRDSIHVTEYQSTEYFLKNARIRTLQENLPISNISGIFNKSICDTLVDYHKDKRYEKIKLSDFKTSRIIYELGKDGGQTAPKLIFSEIRKLRPDTHMAYQRIYDLKKEQGKV